MPVLCCRPGSLNAIALKLRRSDTLDSVRSRCARKLALPGDGRDIQIDYLWCSVWYTIVNDEDLAIFAERHSHSPGIQLVLSGPAIPTTNPSVSGLSSLPSTSARSALDTASVISSSSSWGRATPRDLRHVVSIHVIRSSANHPGSATPTPTAMPSATTKTNKPASESKPSKNGVSPPAGTGEVTSLKSGKSKKSKKEPKPSATADGGDTDTLRAKKMAGSGAKSIAPSIPEHKTKFEEFHNQLGVRTFIGSVGHIKNVRMMMKPGHRACYMSRAFAQEHGFIPKDASLGFYGFSGITNLGTWPITVGRKTVNQQVFLVESSYFPIILGRAFMERRGVKTDALDQASVTFMDTGETIGTDLVIVKDANGKVVPIS